MLRITNNPEDQQGIINMADMPKNSVGKILNNNYGFNGHYVFKTKDGYYFNLTNGYFWTNTVTVDGVVKLLPPGEKIIVEFFNNESNIF